MRVGQLQRHRPDWLHSTWQRERDFLSNIFHPWLVEPTDAEGQGLAAPRRAERSACSVCSAHCSFPAPGAVPGTRGHSVTVHPEDRWTGLGLSRSRAECACLSRRGRTCIVELRECDGHEASAGRRA